MLGTDGEDVEIAVNKTSSDQTKRQTFKIGNDNLEGIVGLVLKTTEESTVHKYSQLLRSIFERINIIK